LKLNSATKKIWRAGIIGCGRIGVEFGDSHARAYMDCEDTELVVACDMDIAKAMKSQAYYVCIDYHRMLETQKLDIISVCTPVETHCQIVCDIAPYVKAIYCEKPMATTLEECDRMIEVCYKHNIILQINHQRRFANPTFTFNNRLTTLTHVFDLIQQWGLEDIKLIPIDTDESIFNLKLWNNNDRLILVGVEHLVECLKERKQSKSSGSMGRVALRLALEFRRMYEKN